MNSLDQILVKYDCFMRKTKYFASGFSEFVPPFQNKCLWNIIVICTSDLRLHTFPLITSLQSRILFGAVIQPEALMAVDGDHKESSERAPSGYHCPRLTHPTASPQNRTKTFLYLQIAHVCANHRVSSVRKASVYTIYSVLSCLIPNLVV